VAVGVGVEAVDGDLVGFPGVGGDDVARAGGVGFGVEKLVVVVGEPGDGRRSLGQVVLVDDVRAGGGQFLDLGRVRLLGFPVGP
jgi:hypothetical protein